MQGEAARSAQHRVPPPAHTGSVPATPAPPGHVHARGASVPPGPGRNLPRRWVNAAFSSDGNRHRHSPPQARPASKNPEGSTTRASGWPSGRRRAALAATPSQVPALSQSPALDTCVPGHCMRPPAPSRLTGEDAGARFGTGSAAPWSPRPYLPVHRAEAVRKPGRGRPAGNPGGQGGSRASLKKPAFLSALREEGRVGARPPRSPARK